MRLNSLGNPLQRGQQGNSWSSGLQGGDFIFSLCSHISLNLLESCTILSFPTENGVQPTSEPHYEEPPENIYFGRKQHCCLRAWIRWLLKVSFNPNYSMIPANSLIYDDQNHSWWHCPSSDDWENSAGWAGYSPVLSMVMIKFYSCCSYSGVNCCALWQHTDTYNGACIYLLEEHLRNLNLIH